MNDEILHICFLATEKDKNGEHAVISKSLKELGLTHAQAMDICTELTNKKTISAWITFTPES